MDKNPTNQPDMLLEEALMSDSTLVEAIKNAQPGVAMSGAEFTEWLNQA